MTGGRLENGKVQKPADFQTGIAAVGFGKFNFLLILICVPSIIAVLCETTLIAFIIPAAACDLNLTLGQKGLLNSTAFVGMVVTGFFWGFLLDTLGRRRILVISFVVEILVVLGESLSQEIYLLSFFKFIGGAITGGAFIAINTYLHEFHSTQYRGRIQMIHGSLYSFGHMLVPIICWAILPLGIHIKILNIDFYAWNLLLLSSGALSMISAIGFYFLPETPKFLMSIGKNDEALNILRRVYSINTGKPQHTYPVISLIEERSNKEESATSKTSWKEYLKSGWTQIAPLFGGKYGPLIVLVCVVQGTVQMLMNSVRLYMPQIFQAIHDYETARNGTSGTLCQVLTVLRTPSAEDDFVCSVNLEDSLGVYLNSSILALVSLTAYIVTAFLMNICERKRLFYIIGSIASLIIGSMYFSQNTLTTLALSSIFVAATNVCFDICTTVLVVVFPTTLRGMAFTTSMVFGRSLVVLGNMALPLLVEAGCAPPFFTSAGLILMAVGISYLIPSTDKVDMK